MRVRNFLLPMSILINGSPFIFFSRSRGLRHGMLYLLRFLWLSWRLSRMMMAIVDRGLLSGFLVE